MAVAHQRVPAQLPIQHRVLSLFAVLPGYRLGRLFEISVFAYEFRVKSLEITAAMIVSALRATRAIFLSVCCATPMMALTGCSSETVSPVADPETPMLIGTNVWSGYEPLYLARSLGYYDDSIRLVEFSSASQVLRAVRNRTIQGAALTLDEALLLRELKHDIRVILVADVSDGGDAILARPDIKTVADLRGRRIGVENTALGGYVLTRALELHEMTPIDVEVVPLQINEQERAFVTKKIDAVVTFDPVRSRLIAEEDAQTIFDSTQIKGEILDVLVMRADMLASRQAQITQILNGWFKARQYVDQHPNDAADRSMARLKLSGDEVLDSFEGLHWPSVAENLEMLDGPAPRLMNVAQKLKSVMLREGLLKEDIDLTGLFWPDGIKTLGTDAAVSHGE